MPVELLTDNWTFQSARELLSNGLQGDTASDIVFSEDRAHFHYRDISADQIRVESLFQILNSVVLADNCVVDADSAHVWNCFDDFAVIRDAHVIVEKPFGQIRDSWRPMRERIEDVLCFCSEVRARHGENVHSFKE